MGNLQFQLVPILIFAIGLIGLYAFGRVLVIPIKILWKLVVNGLIGGIALILINWVGGFVGMYLPINPINALIVGVLGVPGVLLLLILRYLV